MIDKTCTLHRVDLLLTTQSNCVIGEIGFILKEIYHLIYITGLIRLNLFLESESHAAKNYVNQQNVLDSSSSSSQIDKSDR